MSRRAKLLRNIAIVTAGLVVVLAVGTIAVVQTDWFRNYVKQKIITATEEGTGGKVEIASFSFDWRALHATVTDFVIHGTEPEGYAPFLRAGRVELSLRLFTSLKHMLDLTYLGVDRLEANIVVFPDGRTNVPTPKKAAASEKTAAETVVDLAVRRFELTNGVFAFNSQRQAFNLRGANLRAQLWYNVLKQGYQGQVALDPLYVISGRNTPVKFTLTLPIAIERDRIQLHDARISTPASEILINASIENLRNPKTSAHVQGRLALADLKNAGNLQLDLNRRDLISTIDLDANATVADNTIQVNGLRLTAGHSEITASGKLKDPNGNGALDFKARLAVGELGRLADVAARPAGTLVLSGSVKLDADNNYQVTGTLQAKDLSFQNGARRISGLSLVSVVSMDPHRLELKDLRLAAFGGEAAGNASLEEFARYKLNANLRGFDLRTAASAVGQKDLAYAGVASGSIAAGGDLKQPGTRSVTAYAKISIAPGRQGIPVSGRLNADYNGAADNVSLTDSYIALPHTRVTLNGSLGKRLDVALTTRDLNDLLAAMPSSSKPKIALAAGGQATLTGVVTGNLTRPRITANLAANRFSVDGRRFDAMTLDASVSSAGASVSNGSLSRGAMQAQFTASVGLQNWKATPSQPLTATASIRNGDLADIMVLAGQPGADYSGALSANVNVSGTVGNPLGTAELLLAKGTIRGEPFDVIQARVNMADQLITIPAAHAASGAARLDLTADFQHPRESFTSGRLHAHIHSSQMNLAQFRTVQKELPNSAGEIQIQADVTGSLSEVKSGAVQQVEFLLTGVSADASARSLRFKGQDYGDFNVTARTNVQTVSYKVTSNFAGSRISANGNTRLVRDYPTTADASINNLQIERVLALAKRSNIPAKGNLSGSVHFKGSTKNPQGEADLELTSAVLYDEAVERARARVTYLAESVDIPQLEIVSGPARIDLTAKYDHPAGNLQEGKLQFRLNSSRIDLARIQNLQKARPGLGGSVTVAATGSATVRQGENRFLFQALDVNLAATGIAARGKNFGDLTLTANTTGGRLNLVLDSNLAEASIHGRGSVDLSGDYPVNADLTFSNLTWTRAQALLGPGGEPPGFEAVADGQATLSGPSTKIDNLRASLKVTRLQWKSIASQGPGRGPVEIQNQGPITVALEKGQARIEGLNLAGPETAIQASGTASLDGKALNITLKASSNLNLLQHFDRNLVSSGRVVLAATVRGSRTAPLVNGQLELHDASLNHENIPNGISSANGVVQFNGNSASFRNLTAESGGGKLTLGGFVAFRDVVRYGLRANAANVRVRLREGASVGLDASISLTGTTDASSVSGTVTINRVTYAPQSDFGSMLSRAAAPPESPREPSPLLENMKLDIRVRTSAATSVRTSMADKLQADVDLRIRGTASQPGVLGRVSITEGDLVFFGSTYTVNSGTISFYNLARIEPILDINLQTKTKGVNVVLRVTGPIENMKLSYTSDPPLQFQEIVQLLASGKTPTSDPTLLANQPSGPSQSLAQMGESALVSKTLADPVAGRLQRVFGVSQLKVDPTFTTGSNLPQARVTLQQNVTDQVTFTYVTALDDPNTQIIRIEWAFNRRWSAVAARDQNGMVGIKLFYKQQFR